LVFLGRIHVANLMKRRKVWNRLFCQEAKKVDKL
jgi:hypothetical protein